MTTNTTTPYQTVNLTNLFYTRGMEKKEKNDIVCLPHIPFLVFQKVMSRWAESELTVNQVFTEEALVIPGVCQEPARFKIVELSLKTQAFLSERTALKNKETDPKGFYCLLTPDLNNRIATEPASMLQYDPNTIFETVIENVGKKAQNEAQRLMDQIKGLVPSQK